MEEGSTRGTNSIDLLSSGNGIKSSIVSSKQATTKRAPLVVAVDLHPAIVVRANTTCERVEGHQGLGHRLLEPALIK